MLRGACNFEREARPTMREARPTMREGRWRNGKSCNYDGKRDRRPGSPVISSGKRVRRCGKAVHFSGNGVRRAKIREKRQKPGFDRPEPLRAGKKRQRKAGLLRLKTASRTIYLIRLAVNIAEKFWPLGKF